MLLNGIIFEMDWREGSSPKAELPRKCGIYCEVIWPVRGIRIGMSKNIRGRHGGHASWMRSMKKGTSVRSNRSGPLADYAKAWGDVGLETFVLSTDLRLRDPGVCRSCEVELHRWAEEQTDWKNFNAEHWIPANYGRPVVDEVAMARRYASEFVQAET